MEYTQAQWLLFFFIYCFLGWLWESCYVSVQKKEWINRGFLRGPMLPIYGFGAIGVLWLTLPVRNHIGWVFVLGLIGADLLEYVTGAAMERIFHMRYWDYSNQPFNLNGYICLSSTIGWGFFSVFLIRAIHPPIERLLLRLPDKIEDFLSLFFVALFAGDVAQSVRSALDLRELLEKMGENNEKVAALEARLDGVAAILSKRSEVFRDRIREIEESVKETRAVYQLQRELFREEQEKQNRPYRSYITEKLRSYGEKRTAFLAVLSEKANAILNEAREQVALSVQENEKEHLSGLMSELEGFRERLKGIELDVASWKSREYQRAVDMIHRNPSAVSKHFKDALEEIKTLGRR